MKRPIAPPLKTFVLVLEAPDHVARSVPLTELMTVGRLGYGYEGDPIRITTDAAVSSGRHARLRHAATGAIVEDMGSGNTTRLNGALTGQPAALHVGDELQMGLTLLRFHHTLDGNPWPAGADRWLKEVLAAPGDDRPRHAMADWLIDQGDPRGEFIACQLAGTTASQSRAAALLAKHELTWLAPLPMPVERWTFARGFVDRVWVHDVAAATPLRQHHPLTAIEPLAEPKPRPLGLR